MCLLDEWVKVASYTLEQTHSLGHIVIFDPEADFVKHMLVGQSFATADTTTHIWFARLPRGPVLRVGGSQKEPVLCVCIACLSVSLPPAQIQ